MESTKTPGEPGLAQLFFEQVTRQPHQVAVVHIDEHLTYGELDSKARHLAAYLHGLLPFQKEEPVAVLTNPGLDHVVAQVGVAYAGGTCMPLDPAMSDKDIESRIQLAGARVLIQAASYEHRKISILHKIISNDAMGVESEGCQPEVAAALFPVPVRPNHRSHIIFTSGTTGTPKGIELLAHGIARLRREIYSPTDRVACVSGLAFDASLLEIWGPLTIGATMIIFDRELLLNPDTFSLELQEKAITSVMLTASLFNVIALQHPASFRNCNTAITCGEAPNIDALTKIMETAPPKRLLNAYGPAECSVLATVHDVAPEDVKRGEIPLGKALNETALYISDDQGGPPRMHLVNGIDGGITGELLIGGSGVARGYLNNPALTEKSFVQIDVEGTPGQCETREEWPRFYRTKDMVRVDAAGHLFWTGRRDNEIKHRGYRVNLDIIESALHKTTLVRSATALKYQDPIANASWLVACVVLKDPAGVTVEECRREAKALLPAYMVPQIVCLESMPVNQNGKVDRRELAAILLRRKQFKEQTHELEDSQPQGATENSSLTKTEETIRSVWLRALGGLDHGGSDIGPDTDFFHLGATSLDVATAVMMLREAFGISLPVHKIYELPCLRQLGSGIDQEIASPMVDDSSQRVAKWRNQWLRDVDLVEELELSSMQNGAAHIAPAIDWTVPSEGKIFITGVTGFVGAFFLKALIALPSVRFVKCLVRAKSSDEGLRRILDTLRKYQLLLNQGDENDEREMWRLAESKIIPVVGDICDPTLGLDRAEYDDLANWASVIYHFAAQVNYNQPYETHRASNVLGTLNILKLAATDRMTPVHYTSSIAAFGPSGLIGRTFIDEDDSLDPFVDSIPYETGYGQSQWVADKIVKRAMDKGLPATILRLGFVLCDSVSGTGNPDDFMGRIIADVLALGIYPTLPLQRKELLPVNYAVEAIKLISSRPSNLGRAYHIVPDLDDANEVGMDMADLFETIGTLTSRKLEALSYEDWVARLRQVNATGETRLKPLMPILEEKVLDGRTRWELYENMARYRNVNTRSALLEGEKHGHNGLLRNSAVSMEALGRYIERSFVQKVA